MPAAVTVSSASTGGPMSKTTYRSGLVSRGGVADEQVDGGDQRGDLGGKSAPPVHDEAGVGLAVLHLVGAVRCGDRPNALEAAPIDGPDQTGLAAERLVHGVHRHPGRLSD